MVVNLAPPLLVQLKSFDAPQQQHQVTVTEAGARRLLYLVKEPPSVPCELRMSAKRDSREVGSSFDFHLHFELH